MRPSPARVLLVLVLAAGASAQWTVGVGGTPDRAGHADVVGPTAPTLGWSGSLPGIVAQQAVVDGDLVVVNRIESFTIPTGTWIVAHELDTGAIRWQVQLPMSFPDAWRSRVTGIRDGRVYATRSGNTNAEFLYALEPADGSVLWQSQDLVIETTTESVAYASDGDPITTGEVGGATHLLRIEATDGTTVWSIPRTCPTSGGCDAVVVGERVYYWEASPFGPVITAADAVAGVELYSSDAVGAGFIQQVAPFAGPDGTVYAPRSQNNPATDFLVAFDDTGTALVERWSLPIGFVPFASHAFGPDGTLYTYGRDGEVLRVDTQTGTVLDASEPGVLAGGSASPRIATGASGKVFLTNGGFADGQLFVFTPDLRLIWTEAITNVNVGGPALAEDGTLVVCGVGTDVRAYRTDCDGYVVGYGVGCPGTGGLVPSLEASGCPAPGEAVSLTVGDALGGAPALMLVGLGTDVLPVGASCDVQVAPLSGLSIPLAVPAGGSLSLLGTLPASTPVVDVFLQVLVGDGGAPGGLASTPPVQLHVE